MPRGRSSFTKRQKEQVRRQRQLEKAERRTQRKQDKPETGSSEEMDELRQAAEAQAALFRVDDDPHPSEVSNHDPNEYHPLLAKEKGRHKAALCLGC